MQFLNDYYDWLKALHIIALVCWMAMFFYLPRLFVYHAQQRENKAYCDVVKLQEMRLFKYIGTPSFVFTLTSGALLLISNPVLLQSGGWMHAKLLFVAFLVIYHFFCAKIIREFATDSSNRSETFFRYFNEFPTICLIAIVIFVVVRPF